MPTAMAKIRGSDEIMMIMRWWCWWSNEAKHVRDWVKMWLRVGIDWNESILTSLNVINLSILWIGLTDPLTRRIIPCLCDQRHVPSLCQPFTRHARHQTSEEPNQRNYIIILEPGNHAKFVINLNSVLHVIFPGYVADCITVCRATTDENTVSFSWVESAMEPNSNLMSDRLQFVATILTPKPKVKVD